MTKDGLKHSLLAASIVIGAFIVMPIISGLERFRDWIKGVKR